MKTNYILKAKLLKEESALIKQIGTSRKITYLQDKALETGEISPYLLKHKDTPNFNELKNSYFQDKENALKFHECSKIIRSTNKRTYNLTKRVKTILAKSDLLGESALFVTFTFTDDTLASTSKDTRRKYVRRFLKQYCDLYVANIDYGKTNGREHYHAVCLPFEKLDFTKWHIHGAIQIEYIHTPNAKALSKYVSKLTLHAIKETTKRSVLIYNR